VAGVADKHYEYVQASPAQQVTVTHNLGKYPAVTVLDLATGDEMICDVEHVSTAQVAVTHAVPMTFRVECN
jgi:hypothetical protein